MSERTMPPLPPSLAATVLSQVRAGATELRMPLRGYEAPPRHSNIDIATVYQDWRASGENENTRRLPSFTVVELAYLLEHLPSTFEDIAFRKAIQTELHGRPMG